MARFLTRTQAPPASSGPTSQTTCSSTRGGALETTTSAEVQTRKPTPGASSGRAPVPSAGPTVTAVRVSWKRCGAVSCLYLWFVSVIFGVLCFICRCSQISRGVTRQQWTPGGVCEWPVGGSMWHTLDWPWRQRGVQTAWAGVRKACDLGVTLALPE